MPTLFLISSISYTIVAVIFLLFGMVYLLRDQFMPYHSQAIGFSWSQLDRNLQVLILALMRVAGAGFLVTGLTMLLLLLIPWQSGEAWSEITPSVEEGACSNRWSIYALPTISFCACFGSAYATFLVKAKTPGMPPVILTLLGLLLTSIGLIFSLI